MNKRAKAFTKKVLMTVTAPALACAIAFTGIPHLLNASASVLDAKGHFTSDFATLEEAHEFDHKLVTELMGEGMVLMKNKDNALPLNPDTDGITLMGAGSYYPVSAGLGAASGGPIVTTMQDGFREGGFKVNEVMEKTYLDLPENLYQGATIAGVRGYKLVTVQEDPKYIKDVAYSIDNGYTNIVWTLSRISCEGSDLFRTSVPNNKDPHKHILQLSDTEEAMFEYLGELKEANPQIKVFVLLNSPNVMELGDLEDSDTVDGIFWLGLPGSYGLKAVGKVFSGEINPSGRTVDIWNANHRADPTYVNFGDGSQNETWADGKWTSTYNNHVYVDGKDDAKANTVEYEEGIYMGYRWYETAWHEEALEKLSTYDSDYKANGDPHGYYNRGNGVVYPFGYGLSYTTFSQEFVTTKEELAQAINGKLVSGKTTNLDEMVNVQVKVTNTGNRAGKEVVELYVNPPYKKGEIEKPYVQLVSFDKTGLLQPGASEIVSLRVRLADIAAFDYNDANHDSYKGYEIEQGTYNFRIQKNSHELVEGNKNELACSITNTIKLDNDESAENNTPLSNGDDFDTLLLTKHEDSDATMTQLSRADFVGTFPTAPKAEDREYGQWIANLLHQGEDKDTAGKIDNDYGRYVENMNSSDDKTTDPWYKTSVPDDWTQAKDTTGRTNGKTKVQLSEMSGLDYTSDVPLQEGDPFYEAGKNYTQKDAWVLFMNQLTYDEIKTLLNKNSQGRTPGLAAVGKNEAKDEDGPTQIARSNGGYTFCSGMNIASTWNVDLAYARGYMVGHDSLFIGITGWYAPSMNTHRSPFGGRNFEYYAQEGLLAGFIGAAEVAGFQAKGGYAFIKHFALNEQETNRSAVGTWVSEQAAREIYFKSFEYSIKTFDWDVNVTIDGVTITADEVGGAQGIMTSYNRVGAINSQVSYPLKQTIAREEWGFNGQIVTDAYPKGSGKMNMLIRTGGSMPLGTNLTGFNVVTGEWDASLRSGKGGVRDGNVGADGKAPESATQYYWARMSAMEVLFTGANSNVMKNGIDTSVLSDIQTEAQVGEELNVNISAALPVESAITYRATSELPAGVKLTADGVLSGRPEKVGTYTIDVELRTQLWITTTARITLNVTPLLSSKDAKEGKLTAKVGEAFSTKFEQELFYVGYMFDDSYLAFSDSVGRLTEITYSLRTPVPGLKLNSEDGTLSGTPTEGGTHEIVVRTTVNYKSDRGRAMSANFDTTFTLEIEGEGSSQPGTSTVEPQFRVNDGKLEYSIDNGSSWQTFEQATAAGKTVEKFEIKDGHLNVTYSDGTTQDLGNVVGPKGDKGDTGVAGQNGQNGQDGGGCGGVIGVGAAALAAVTILGGAAIVLRKKHD